MKCATILVTLLVVISIAVEILFPDIAEHHRLWIEFVDMAFVGVIVADLSLRYKKIGNRRQFLKKYWIDVVFLIVFVGVLRLLKNARVMRSASSILGDEAELMRIGNFSVVETPAVVGKIGKMSIHTVHVSRFAPLSKVSKLFKVRKILSGKESELLVLKEKILS